MFHPRSPDEIEIALYYKGKILQLYRTQLEEMVPVLMTQAEQYRDLLKRQDPMYNTGCFEVKRELKGIELLKSHTTLKTEEKSG